MIFLTTLNVINYFNFHQLLLKSQKYFGSGRRISDLIVFFRRDVTK